MHYSSLKIPALLLALGFSANAFAKYPIYIVAKGGVFNGYFSNKFTDQTDVIQQNISEDATQYGYIASLAIGFNREVGTYLVGAELSGNLDNHQALYQAGAATAAFSDTIKIMHHGDACFVPGILLNNTMVAYLKVGLSVAWLQDKVSSPVGFAPTLTNFNSNRTAMGAALGIGLKKAIAHHIFILTEANYHDYGNVNFATMQNFSATYSHSTWVHSFDFVVGIGYQF